jgi:hypothetical protein
MLNSLCSFSEIFHRAIVESYEGLKGADVFIEMTVTGMNTMRDGKSDKHM